MKRIAIIAAALLMAAPPLMASAAPDGGGRDRGEGRGEGRGRYEGRGGGPGVYADPRGAPPPGYGGPPRGGPTWRQGQYLPPQYRGSVVQDRGRYRLRAPPPGYDWVGVGPDIYLMQRSTGMVLDIIPGGY